MMERPSDSKRGDPFSARNVNTQNKIKANVKLLNKVEEKHKSEDGEQESPSGSKQYFWKRSECQLMFSLLKYGIVLQRKSLNNYGLLVASKQTTGHFESRRHTLTGRGGGDYSTG